MLEIVILDKYLVRGMDTCYAFSRVKEGKPAVVLRTEKIKKINGVEVMAEVPDYSNFGDECYPSTFAACLRKIVDEEVRYSNIKASGIEGVKQIVNLVGEVNQKIERIDEVFKHLRK